MHLGVHGKIVNTFCHGFLESGYESNIRDLEVGGYRSCLWSAKFIISKVILFLRPKRTYLLQQ
jgi:hypothetical protein